MKKRENRVVKSLIAGVLCLSQLQIPVNVLAAEGEPENLALNKTTSASALEVADGRFTDEMAVDGNREGDSRWSSGALTASSPQLARSRSGQPADLQQRFPVLGGFCRTGLSSGRTQQRR